MVCAHDMDNGETVFDQFFGDHAAMAMTPVGLRTHDRDRSFARQRFQLGQSGAELRGFGIGRIMRKRRVARINNGWGGLRFFAFSAQRHHMNIIDSGVFQGFGKGRPVELRVAFGTWERTHVGQRLDVTGSQ